MAKGICAIIPSDAANPAVDEPIPAYAQAWDPTIRRPTHLPEDYDERIAPEYIFFLPAGPEETADGLTEAGVYVVARKCDHCERLRKACTRARPTCQMCHAGRHDCVTSDPGYVHLSGPKGTRPSRAKGGVTVPPARHSIPKTKTSARAQTEDAPIPRATTHPRLRTLRQRSTTSSRESLQPPDSRTPSPTLSEELPRRAKTAPHENEGRHHDNLVPSMRDTKPNKKRKAKPADGPSRSKKSKVETSASGGRKASGARKKKRPAGHILSTNDKPDANPTWVVVPPTSGPTDASPTLVEPHARPRIWATSKQELLEVHPALKNEVNGVVWGSVEAPILCIQGPTWPGDQWHGQTAIEFTMIRRRLQHPSAAQQFPEAGPMNVSNTQDDYAARGSSVPISSISTPVTDVPSDPPQLYAFHPSAQLDGLSVPSDRPSTSPRAHSERPVTSSPGLEFVDHQTVPATSPHPAPLALLCEASSLAENFAAIGEPIQETTKSAEVVVRGSPANLTVNAARSRSSSVSSGMSYDEARDLSGSSYGTTLTSVLSWKPDYLSPSLSDTRFRTSNVREDPEEGDAVANADLKHSLFQLHAARWTQPLAPSSYLNSRFSYPSHGWGGQPTYPASDPGPIEPADAMMSHLPPASDSHSTPPELSALQEHYKVGLPVAVVLCRDSALWTFDLPPKYGCVLLGFFNITRMGYTHMDSNSLRCRIRLEWTPGGDSPDPTMQPPLTPWWVAPDGSATDRVDSEMVLHPYSFLPLHILAVSAFSDKDRAIGVSEATSAEGWHCQSCGKLNVQRNLRLQRCSDCARENGLPPIRVDYVRNPHLMAPSSRPWDKTYGNVASACKRLSDGSCTQIYTIDSRAIVKHIYTCNRPEVQRGSSRLFTAIQRDTELVQRKASGSLVAGSHYIAVFGDSTTFNSPCTPWSGVPSSVTEAREMFQERCRTAGDWPSFVIDKMVITAWMDAGSKKGCLMPAKGVRMAMYCLGADMEISIYPKSLASEGKTMSVQMIKTDLNTSITLDDEADGGDSRVVYQSMQIKDEEDTLRPDLDSMVVDDPEPQRASVSGRRATQKKGAIKEPLFVTLVHGDMLLFESDDFEYTLKRTGMSIVLTATDAGQGAPAV